MIYLYLEDSNEIFKARNLYNHPNHDIQESYLPEIFVK